MSNELSEQAVSSWNEYTRLWYEYSTAGYNLCLTHRSELAALVKRGLHSAHDAPIAFKVAETLTAEEKRTLLPDLLGWCSSAKYGSTPRDLILDMPHDWLIETIEMAAEPALSQNDFLDWVNILSLFADIDLNLAHRLAQRMLVHSDSELREWGEEFLNKHSET
jgi:hypothetical protein